MSKKRSPKKKKARVARKNEVVVRVHAHSAPPSRALVPTVNDLTEPMTDDKKKLTIPKTWLSDKQILRLTEKTPPAQVYQRPGKGGKKWDYVTVSYVQRVLDFAFGFNWDFEVVEHGKEKDHVWVLGRLTVKNPEGTRSIVKTQFGRSEVKYQKDSDKLLDYGNDLKAAASDALKKCASMLGIARDIYGKGDYRTESGNEPRDGGTRPPNPPPTADTGPSEPLYCVGARKGGCPHSAELSKPAADYSKQVYGKRLCAECQKNARPLKRD